MQRTMILKTMMRNSAVQFFAVFLLSLAISVGFVLFYWYFVDSNYLKLIILYLGSTFLFASAGVWAALRVRRYAVTFPLFLVSFCWFSFYAAQRLSGSDLFYEMHLMKEMKEVYEQNKEAKRPDVSKNILQEGKKLLESKDYRNAERYLISAVDLDKNNAEAYFALGDFYSKVNNPFTAIMNYSKGLEIDFNKPAIHYKFGILCYKIGEVDLAINALHTASVQDSSIKGAGDLYVSLLSLKKGEEMMEKQGMLQVSQIVLPSREQAQEILKRALNGEHFGALAFQYSIDEQTKVIGGIARFFDPNKNEYVFTDEVKKMKIGDIRGVFEYDGKYFIIKRRH